jgi:hypothetical protein
MRGMVLGALAGAVLMLVALGTSEHRDAIFAQQFESPGRAVGGDQLITLSTPSGENGQLLMVIDPVQRVIGVYRVDLATGKIALRSVRNINWDLRMSEFNGENPLPREIRSLLEQR